MPRPPAVEEMSVAEAFEGLTLVDELELIVKRIRSGETPINDLRVTSNRPGELCIEIWYRRE